ncbi:MAG: hypothetical protein ABIR26_16205 [Ramlibacter sp.]
MTVGDIENYYARVIRNCLSRMLLPPESVDIRVRRAASVDGRIGFAGYVRILDWDPVLTPVVLQNLPVLDRRVRKVVEASVILEGTHFTGLWFQVTAEATGSPDTLVGLPSELVHRPRGPA